MNKKQNETKVNIETEVTKILSLGSSLDLNLTLSLTQSQCEQLNINYTEINSLSQMKAILMPNCELNQAIVSFIFLSSPNFLINSLFYINRANKTKSFVEYAIPFKPKYSYEALFMKEVVKYVTQHNLLFIVEKELLNIVPSIKFTFRLLENNSLIKETKIFTISNECEWDNNTNSYSGDLFSSLNIEYKHSIFYSSINDLIKSKIVSYDEILSFLQCLKTEKPDMLICINYSSFFDDPKIINIDLIQLIKETLKLTDMSLFESKEAKNYFYFHKRTSETALSMSSKDKEENNDINKIDINDYFIRELDSNSHSNSKDNKRKMKIGIFIDELKTITIIQQNPLSELVLFHSKYECSFYSGKPNQNDINDYCKLLIDNSDLIKSIFVGGLLSRLFNKKSYQTCVTAGNEIVRRVIDLIRYDIDFPTTQVFYEILVKKPKTLSNRQLDIKKKEDQFVLDCTNVISSQKKNYNPLYDNMCASYFHSPHHRLHLMKLGFTNKKGLILQDPTAKEYICTQDKSLIYNYEKQASKFFNKKEKNEIMNHQMKSIANTLSSLNQTSTVSALSFLTHNKNNTKMLSRKKLPNLNPKGTYYHQKKLIIKNYNSFNVSSPTNQSTTKGQNETNDHSNTKRKFRTDDASSDKTLKEKDRMIRIKKFSLDKSNFISMLNDIEKKIKKKPNAKEKMFYSDDD